MNEEAMINSKMNEIPMRRNTDPYSFSAGSLPTREASSGSLPPIVEEIFKDVDGVYAQRVQKAGLCNHPQIVAATVAEFSEPYVLRLLEADPVVGCGVLYGTLTIRGTQYFFDALEIANDTLLYSKSLSTMEIQLLVHAVETAIASRNLSDLEGDSVTERIKRFSEIRDTTCTERHFQDQETIENHFPTFSRYRAIIDEIKRATLAEETPSAEFFGSVEPTVENYLKAAFGTLTKADSPMQRSALEFFTKLDKALRNKFTFGLQHSYLSNEGPSQPFKRD
jgi:hypothetical protein